MSQRTFFTGFLFFFLISGSLKSEHFTAGSWNIDIDNAKEHFSISHTVLGSVLTNIRFGIEENGEPTMLHGWQYQFLNREPQNAEEF